jgi:hypothetical protein
MLRGRLGLSMVKPRALSQNEDCGASTTLQKRSVLNMRQYNFEVQTCATLLANQASGRWACHAPTLIPLLHTTMELLGYANASIEYTDKETNRAVKGAWLAFEMIKTKGLKTNDA